MHSSGPARSATLMPTAPPVDVWMMTSVRARILRIASRKRAPSCDARPSSSRTCRWITDAPASAQRSASAAELVRGERQMRILRARRLGADDRRGHDARPRPPDRRPGARTFSGTTQVPRARQTTIGSARRSADDSNESSRRGVGTITLRATNSMPSEVLPQRVMRPLGLDEVAGAHRRQELHRVVGAKQPLVAVGADAQLGRHVAEKLQHLRAVDQSAGVVRVIRPHSNSYARFHFSSPMC